MEWEGDAKHVAGMLKEADMECAKGVETPGVKSDDAGDDRDLPPAEAAAYRRGTARINYIAQDRADLSYASKELSRTMSKPVYGDVARLTRVIRCLSLHPRWVMIDLWQELVDEITVLTDSYWGGCLRTRKSTS